MAKSNILIIGNWKSNPETETQAIGLARAAKKTKGAAVVLAAPVIFLSALKKELRGSKIALAAQDVSIFPGGAHTGEISAQQLKKVGVSYVLVGHSERRALGETDEIVNQKIRVLLQNGITPVVCIGEKERDEHGQFTVAIREQLKNTLAGISKAALARIVLVYEPVWAISSSVNHRDITVTDCHEMVVYMRKVLSDIASPQIASSVRVIYGGSANALNAQELLTEGGVTGLLPGHASLDAKEFTKIIAIASQK